MSSIENKNNLNTQQNNTKQKHTKNTNIMDADNAKALEIMTIKGPEAAVKHMFNPTGKQRLSYAEMRMRFG